MVDSLKGDIVKSGAIITSDFFKGASHRIFSNLESILLNLLSNALKYSSPLRTAKIHFQSQIINDETVLTVCDNGLGIDLKEHGTDIFDLTKCSISTLTQKEFSS
jgi:signal transduction histidine kinase